ncbi:hypothetical protein [Psychromicrobium xiongbiense]|uniref:hypothetical protein n=1 Tax=Psychromicrobium xiongbiense TaxID=3051184 RepID=UPI002557B2B4|nr:hypothetical protein [Psychromicrobium sp. YIM S02556]
MTTSGLRTPEARASLLRALLGFFIPLSILAAVVMPLLGSPSLMTALVATAAVCALSASGAMLVTRSAARPAAVRLVNRDYPGPERFRVADDPHLSGRPRPRAPSSSCSQ